MRATPAPSALEGMAGHTLVQLRRGKAYETEIRLEGQCANLTVRGRADGFDPEAAQLEEIKTYRGKLEGIRDHHRSLHWAQAKIYAHLLCKERELAQVSVALVYYNVGTGEETVLTEMYEASALREFFELQCTRFLEWAQREEAHRSQRDEALRHLKFPLEKFRTGQRELAVAVYRSARSETGGQALMIQAPTGIGKTIGTIFPMLKAFPGGPEHAGLDKLFFLTAKGTGHALALQALDTLNESLVAHDPDVRLRVLNVRAREKACEHPDKACHGDSCPLAKGFFDRLPEARAQVVDRGLQWDVSSLRHLALEYQLCPYYLVQELVRWSDVVVADYNYYYDASAMLHAFTQTHQWKVGVLVDEAHNLLDRARSMYTAELSSSVLADAIKAVAGAQHTSNPAMLAVRKSLARLRRVWSTLDEAQEESYKAYESVPAALLNALQRAVSTLSDVQADQPLLPGDPLLPFYWQAQQLMTLAEDMGDHSFFDLSRSQHLKGREGEGVESGAAGHSARTSSTLCVRNVIPAPHLQDRHTSAQASVLFSGTLSPAVFYQDTLGLPEETSWMEVDSPFQAAQLSVRVASHISTRYRDRERSLQPIADLIAEQYFRQPGNYFCFFSSFDYLQRAAEVVQQKYPQLPIWLQTPGMNEASRKEFLHRFLEQGEGIGFAVLGGAFSEGVDLPGRRLIGAFVATLGLPQINPVNEQMKQTIDRTFGNAKGYDYTFLYPGMRKVVQAAGRVIRSENDQGVVVLIDDRFRRKEVQALLPQWWRMK